MLHVPLSLLTSAPSTLLALAGLAPLLSPGPQDGGQVGRAAEERPLCTLVLDARPLPPIVQGVVPITAPEHDPLFTAAGEPRDAPVHWVTADGFAVDREPVLWDRRGRPVAYRVHLPVRPEFRGRERSILAATEPGRTELEGLAGLSGIAPVELALRTTDGRRFACDLVPRRAGELRPGHWIDRGATFLRPRNDAEPPEEAMAVHSYVEGRADGVVVFTVRLSNGSARPDGSGAQGAVWFDELRIDVPTGWSLVATEVDGGTTHRGRWTPFPAGAGPYVLDERRQTIRRFALHLPGRGDLARRVLAGFDLARAEGDASYLAGGYGSRAEMLPDFDRPPLRDAWRVGPLRGFEALEHLGSEALRRTVRALVDGRGNRPGALRALGLCHPDGQHERGEPGGWLIESVPGCGYLTRAWTSTRRLEAERMAERMPTAFDLATGEPLTASSVAAAHEGIFPFEIHLTGGRWEDKHELPYWRDLPPVGEPREAVSETLAALRRFAPIDAEHFGRAFLHAYAWALSTGDDLARDLVQEAAARCEMEWNMEPSPPLGASGQPRGFWRDPSLVTRLAAAEAEPGRGLWSTRDFAWTIEAVVAAFRLTPPGPRRDELQEWMQAAARFIDRVQLPSAVCMARFPRKDAGTGRYWSGLAPDPFQNGALEPDWAAAQWLEESLRGNACASLAENIDDPELAELMEEHVRRLAATLLASMRSLERKTPPKWIGVRPGTDELCFTDWGSENFQSQSLLRLGGAPPETIWAIHGEDGTFASYLSQIARATREWAPHLFSHAAVVIAEAVNAKSPGPR